MLDVEDLSFSYGAHPVFADITFQVAPAKLCGLFGPNGSGKSTLFKCCLKLLKNSKGSVSISGKKIENLSTAHLARLVSYVPQAHTPPFPFPVREVVLMGRAPFFGGVFGLSESDRKIADEAMRRLDIFDLADKAYTCLSGGQRQLVLIARALAQNTPFIMLDEPTASLDFKNQLLIWQVLRNLTDSGKTVFVCAHDPNHVLWFCDEVIVMHQGGIMTGGKPSDVLNEHTLRALYGDICASGELHGRRLIYPEKKENCLFV